MLIFKHNTQLKQLKELREIQKEKSELCEELDQYKKFPYPFFASQQCTLKEIDMISDGFASVLTAKMSFEDFQNYVKRHRNLSSKELMQFFTSFGKFLINLEGNVKEIKELEYRINELRNKENKLKSKLGIK